MTNGRSYGSPGAFRRALTDKLRDLATRSRWTLQQLQRQMAYDRLLERLYLVDEGWIIKGATALLARDIGVRGTIDIDLYREVARAIAETDLRRAAALDIGDWFRFEIGPPQLHADTGGVRLPMTALVGNTVWVQFHVDLVGADLRMTGEPEDVPPLARVVMPDVEQHGYRAYPLVDHVADKVCAIIERHGPTEARPRDSATSSISSPSSSPRPWRPNRRWPHCDPRRSDAICGCRGGSPSQTGPCGNLATPPRPDDPSCRRREPWTKPWPRSHPSSTRSWMGVRAAGGTRTADDGRGDSGRVPCPDFHGGDPRMGATSHCSHPCALPTGATEEWRGDARRRSLASDLHLLCGQPRRPR